MTKLNFSLSFDMRFLGEDLNLSMSSENNDDERFVLSHPKFDIKVLAIESAESKGTSGVNLTINFLPLMLGTLFIPDAK